MALAIGLGGEGITALLAIKRPLTRVSSHVTNHETFFKRAVIADLALVRLNLDMFCLFMIVQIMLREEAIRAQFTMVAAFLDRFLLDFLPFRCRNITRLLFDSGLGGGAWRSI